jgi:polyhydroxyalkanoate synthesis regulator phasin
MNADKAKQLVTQLVVHGQLNTERTQQVLDFLKEDTSCSIGMLASLVESLLKTIVEHAGRKELQRLWVPQIRDVITKLDDLTTTSSGRKKLNEDIYGTLDRVVVLVEESKSLNSLNGDKSFKSLARNTKRAVQLFEAEKKTKGGKVNKAMPTDPNSESQFNFGQLTTGGVLVTDGEDVEFERGNLSEPDRAHIQKLLKKKINEIHSGSSGSLERFVELVYSSSFSDNKPFVKHGMMIGKKKLFMLCRGAQLNNKSKQPVVICNLLAVDMKKYNEIIKDGYADQVLRLMNFQTNEGKSTVDQVINSTTWRSPAEILQPARSQAVKDAEAEARGTEPEKRIKVTPRDQNIPPPMKPEDHPDPNFRSRAKNKEEFETQAAHLRKKVADVAPDLDRPETKRIPVPSDPQKFQRHMDRRVSPNYSQTATDGSDDDDETPEDNKSPEEKPSLFGGGEAEPLFGGEEPDQPLFGGNDTDKFEMFGGAGEQEEQDSPDPLEEPPAQEPAKKSKRDHKGFEDLLGPPDENAPVKKNQDPPTPKRDEPLGVGEGPTFDPLTGHTEHVPLPPEKPKEKQDPTQTKSFNIDDLTSTSTALRRPEGLGGGKKPKRGAAEKRAEREQINAQINAREANKDDWAWISTAINDVGMLASTHTGKNLGQRLEGINDPGRVYNLFVGLTNRFQEFKRRHPSNALDYSRAILNYLTTKISDLVKQGIPGAEEEATRIFRALHGDYDHARLGLNKGRILNLYNTYRRQAGLPNVTAAEAEAILAGKEVSGQGVGEPAASKKEFKAPDPEEAVPGASEVKPAPTEEPQAQTQTGFFDHIPQQQKKTDDSADWDNLLDQYRPDDQKTSAMVPPSEVVPGGEQETPVSQDIPEELPPEPPIHRGPKIQVLHGQRSPDDYDHYRLARIRGKVKVGERDGKPVYADKYVYMSVPREDNDGNAIVTDDQIWEYAKSHYERYLSNIARLAGTTPDAADFRQKLEQVRADRNSDGYKQLKQSTEQYNRNFQTDAIKALSTYRTKLATASDAEPDAAPMGKADGKVWFLKRNFLGKAGSPKDQVLRALERNSKVRPTSNDTKVIDLVLRLDPDQFDELVYRPLYSRLAPKATAERAAKYYEYLSQKIPDEQFAESIRRFITIGEDTGDVAPTMGRAASDEEIAVVQKIILMNDIAQYLRTKEGLSFLVKVGGQAGIPVGTTSDQPADEQASETPTANPGKVTPDLLRKNMQTLEVAVKQAMPRRRPQPAEAKKILAQIQDPKQYTIAQGLLLDPRRFSAALRQARQEIENRIEGHKNPLSYFATLTKLARALGSLAPQGGKPKVANMISCPYCKEAVDIDSTPWTACSRCLARHHSQCWRENRKRCASCGNASAMKPAPQRARVAPTGPREQLERLRGLYEEAYVSSTIIEQTRAIARGLVESALTSSRVVSPAQVMAAFKEYQQTLNHYGLGELVTLPISESVDQQLVEIHCLTSDPIDQAGWDTLTSYRLDPAKKIRELSWRGDDPIGSKVV